MIPQFILVDLENDFLVSGADTEEELLPHAEQYLREEQETGMVTNLAIYELKSEIEA